MTIHCACKPSCRWAADPGEPYALSHDPRPERAEARREMMSARGRAGQMKRHERSAAGKRTRCSLRTAEDHLAELELTLIELERSGGEMAVKAKTKVAIIALAHELLKSGVEATAKKLNELLDAHPELARRLQAVK